MENKMTASLDKDSLEIDHSLFLATIGNNHETGKFVVVVIQEYVGRDGKKDPCYYDRGMSKDLDTIEDAIEYLNTNIDHRIRKAIPDDLEKYKIVSKIKSGMYISQFLHKDKDLCRIEVRSYNDYRLNPLFTITEDELCVLEYSKKVELDCTGYDKNEKRYHYYVI